MNFAHAFSTTRLFYLLVLTLPDCSISTQAKATQSAPESLHNCLYTQGHSDTLIIGSTLLLRDKVIHDGGAAILASGKIGQIGLFSDVINADAQASVLDCRGSTVLSSGWVNIHEHEAFSYEYPSPDLQAVYHHREEWIFGRNNKQALPIPKEQVYDKQLKQNLATLASVELRHLITGTTTLGGPGAVPGLVKNINNAAGEFELLRYPLTADLEIFPFSLNSIETFSDYCSEKSKNLPVLKINSAPNIAYAPHVGEGRRDNCTAQSEIESYLNYVLQHRDSGRRFTVVHGVAARPDQLKRISDLDMTLVWSPRSNLALYGETIDLDASRKHGVRMALGTDWAASGSFNMLEELGCARIESDFQQVAIDAHQMWLMATHNAAYAAGLDKVLGEIKPGLAADLVLINNSDLSSPYKGAIEAQIKDILTVWVDGKLMVADPGLHKTITKNLAPAAGCANLKEPNKVVCADFAALGVQWQEIKTLSNKSVPLNGDVSNQALCRH